MTGPVGRWRIVEATAWSSEHLDLCAPTFSRIDADGSGTMAFDNGDKTTFIPEP